jgi:hypothetical protein
VVAFSGRLDELAAMGPGGGAADSAEAAFIELVGE